jgi:hypothetical protein
MNEKEQIPSYSAELKKRLPYAAYGVGTGAGLLAAHKLMPGKKRALLAAPLVFGAGSYLGASALANEGKVDPKAVGLLTAMTGGSLGGIGYDALVKKRMVNPLSRSALVAGGALTGGLISVAIAKKLRERRNREKENTNNPKIR